MKLTHIICLSIPLALLTANISFAETVWLDSLNLSVTEQGWGTPHKDQSVDGKVLSIGGKQYARGLGTHAESMLNVKLDGNALNFTATVGVDDEVGNNPNASVEFFVIGDGKTLWQSGLMHAGDAPKYCKVDLAGVKNLLLKVGDGDNGIDHDHADWADAKIESKGASTFVVSGREVLPYVAPYILTPPTPPTPRINGASV